MPSIASVSIKFLADLKGFSTQMQNANRKIASVGKNLQRTGRTLTTGLTLPLVGLAAVSLKTFDTQAKAIAQVEAGLKSTGGQVGKTSQELQGLASNLQNLTTFGDEEILSGVTSQLLTFTNIANQQFERTQIAALDLATRLNGDLKSASIQLGKALNDPVANLSALSRSGIQFSTAQKATINSLVETNRLAEAQTIILDELEKQYGGSAAAAAQAGLGPFKQLANILGDVTEEFGGIIAEIILPFAETLKTIANNFKSLSPETKKFIVILGGIAAAIGPLLILAGTILPAIATGFTILTGPIGLIVAGLTAIGVIIVKNWQPIKGLLIDIANYFIDLYNESTVVRVGVQAIITTFKNLFDVGRFAFETLKNIIGSFIDNVVNGFKTFGRVVKAIFTGNFSQIPDILKENVSEGVDTFKGFTQELKNDWKNLTDNIKQNGQDAIEAITTRNKIEFLKDDVDASGVEASVSEAVKTGLAKGLSNNALSGGTPQVSALSTISATGPQEVTTASPLDGIVAALPPQLAIVDELLLQGLARMNAFREGAAEIMQGAAEGVLTGFGQLIAGFATGNAGLGDVAALILTTIGDMAIRLGKLAISIGIAVEGIKAALKSLNPAVAIAAGIALVALGTLVKSAASNIANGGDNIPRFNDGGIVGGSSFIGDKILARVNSGELILNQRQQRNLLGQLESGSVVAQPVIPEVVISGEDLRLLFDRAERNNNRRT